MASNELKQEIRAALDNSTLARTLGNFCKTYPARRENAYAGVDFEATREKIKEVKNYAADHVDEMIEEFTANCEKRGGHVFHAHSTEEAMEWIRNLVKEKGVKSIVKSKSMASEEIHFNKVLGDDGVMVQETDLGEFIIALEGNTPVHMVMPALHLNKEQVADLFTDYTKVKNEPIISEEVRTARRVMRDRFTHADMGVSGANVAVAETGTVFTMTNEGNGRMVGTLPPIHLYIFGIEKFVKSFKDAAPIFKALPRNGTAQRITSYISMYTGASEVVTDKENDTKAKKEFYAVILDDPGRRQMLEDKDFRQVFDCIRCGACLDVCPAFALVGGHVYGSKVYTGGIGTLLSHFLVSEERSEQIQSICLQCGRCKEVCGGGLHIPEMIPLSQVLLGLFGLPLQRPQLPGDLGEDIRDPDQVALLLLQFFQRSCFSALKFYNARCLVKELSSVIRLSGKDLVDLALADDRIALLADSGIIKQLIDIPKPAVSSIQKVFTLTGTVKPPCDGDLIRVQIQLPVTVIQRDGHRGIAQRFSRLRAGKDNVLHIAAAELLCALLAKDPADRVADIALSASVGTHDAGHAVMKIKLCFSGKGFESLHLDRL